MSLMFASKSQQLQAQNFQDWKDKCITYNLWKEIEIGSSKGCSNRYKKKSYNTNQVQHENACTFKNLLKTASEFSLFHLYHNLKIKTSNSIQVSIKTIRFIHSMYFKLKVVALEFVEAPLKALFWL